MKRIAPIILLFLGLAASAARAQSIIVNPPRPPLTPVLPFQGAVDLSVNEVVSVVDTGADSRSATLRLSSGAAITVGIWSPATPPMWAFRPYIDPIPAALVARALQCVQNNAASFTLPFTFRVWRNSIGYSVYSGTELQLFVPSPVHFPGNASTGGLAELKVAVNGTLAVGMYMTWGYLILESDSGSRRTFHLLSSANTAGGQTAINLAAMEDLCSTVLQNPLWVGLTGVYRDVDRFICNGTGWYK